MYQCIKAGKLIGEFYSYQIALMIAELCHTAIYFNGPKGLERLQ